MNTFLEFKQSPVMFKNKDGRIVLPILYSDFPKLYKAYIAKAPSTHCVECLGEKILNGKIDFAGWVQEFVRFVCWWGGFDTICTFANHLDGDQNRQNVAIAVLGAVDCLRQKPIDIESAMNELRQINGLGSMSLPSKILRMLAPQEVGCFDSRLQNEFGRKISDAEYAKWCMECKGAAKKLKIRNPYRKNGVWYAADVEAVVFHVLDPRKIAENPRTYI